MRWHPIGLLLAACLAACGGSDSSSSCPLPSEGRHWIGAWATAPTDASRGFADQSLRMILHPTFGGDMVRVRLSNRYGAQPIAFASATLGVREDGPAVRPGTLRRLTFGCSAEVVVEPGEEVVSDPVALSFSAFEDLAVSMHVEGEVPAATRHEAAYQTSFVATADAGDVTGAASGAAFTETTTSWFFVHGLEVVGPPGSSAIVAIGDSITDGMVSGGRSTLLPDPDVVDRNGRYPDRLAERLAAEGRFSVLNLGIGGNRLLAGPLFGAPTGESLLDRLDADVLGQAGVTDVIVQIGTNDLGMPLPRADAAEVIAGLEDVVDRLHAAGLNVLLSTQTPATGPIVIGFHGSQRAIEDRNQINDWVRTESRADAVIDFHAALSDPTRPDAMLPVFDSGDHLHPSLAGYQAMADAIDLGALRGARE